MYDGFDVTLWVFVVAAHLYAAFLATEHVLTEVDNDVD